MHSGYRFSELGDSMGIGFLADQIVLALAKAAAEEYQLSTFEQESLRKGAADLDAALEGDKRPRTPRFARAQQGFQHRTAGLLWPYHKRRRQMNFCSK